MVPICTVVRADIPVKVGADREWFVRQGKAPYVCLKP
jgi:hypothetical protein